MIYPRLQDLLMRPRAALWIAGLALLLYSPYLLIGLIADDFYHYAIVHGALGVDGDWLLGLFRFVNDDASRTVKLIEQGMLPWWTVSNFRFVFFRPLTALTHFIDYGPFGGLPMLAHLHSLLWLLASLAAVHFCTRQMQISRLAVVLALLVFAVDSTHASTVGWLSNRSAIIACSFGLFGMGWYLRYAADQRPASLAAALVLLALALTAGEIALAIVAMVAGYVLMVVQRPLLQKVLILAPLFGLVLLYLVSYKAMGLGAGGDMKLYTNPLGDPATFLQVAMLRVQVLAFGTLGLLPSDILAANLSLTAPQLIVIAIGFVLLIALLWRQLRSDRHLLFMLLAIFVCCIPISATTPADRNLFVATYPAAVFVALVLEKTIGNTFQGGSFSRRGGRVVAAVLLVCNVLLSALLVPVWGILLRQLSSDMERWTREIAAVDGGIGGKTLVMVDAPFMIGAMAAPVMYYLGMDLPQNTYWVAGPTENLSIAYGNDGQLLLSAPEGLVATADEQLFRDPVRAPFTVNEAHEFRNLRISVQAVSPQHLPTQVKLELNPQLPADQFVVLRFHDGKVSVIPRGT